MHNMYRALHVLNAPGRRRTQRKIKERKTRISCERRKGRGRARGEKEEGVSAGSRKFQDHSNCHQSAITTVNTDSKNLLTTKVY